MLRNDQDARDATQDTLLKVMRHLERYNPRFRFSTWVFGIARNTCIDEYRRRRRLVNLPPERDVKDDGPSPAEEAGRAFRSDRLHAALEQLPDMYREILVLYHFEHLKYSEISEVLGIPMGTVMNRIFRARRRLRKLYGEELA
jgi:RNA polymerase sigma-70 factor (ECF subfamily)